MQVGAGRRGRRGHPVIQTGPWLRQLKHRGIEAEKEKKKMRCWQQINCFIACRAEATTKMNTSHIDFIERGNVPFVMDATNMVKMQLSHRKVDVDGTGWYMVVTGMGVCRGRGGGSEWRACGGSRSHRCGRGLRRGLRQCCRGDLRLGLGLGGAGWGGTRGWGRAREGGGGAATGGLGVRQVSGPPCRGGGGGSRRRRGVQGGLGGG